MSYHQAPCDELPDLCYFFGDSRPLAFQLLTDPDGNKRPINAGSDVRLVVSTDETFADAAAVRLDVAFDAAASDVETGRVVFPVDAAVWSSTFPRASYFYRVSETAPGGQKNTYGEGSFEVK